MASIILLVIVVAVAAALLGSVLFQSLTPISNVILSPVEKKCQEIANEGYLCSLSNSNYYNIAYHSEDYCILMICG